MIRRNLPRHGYEDDYNGTYYRIHRTQFAYSKHSQVLRAVPGTIRCPSTITATWILHYTKENTRKTVTHSPHYIKKKNLKLQTVSDVVTMCEENRKKNIEKKKYLQGRQFRDQRESIRADDPKKIHSVPGFDRTTPSKLVSVLLGDSVQ